ILGRMRRGPRWRAGWAWSVGAPGRRLAAGLLLALIVAASQAAGADAVRFRLQPEASEVTFRATSRLMNADGSFHRVTGFVDVDPRDLASATISVPIDAHTTAPRIPLARKP